MKIRNGSIFNKIKILAYNKECYKKPIYSELALGSTRKMTCNALLNCIPKVDIDPSGVFKYILIKVYDSEKDGCCKEPFITLVRGYARCNYHSDLYNEVAPKLKPFYCEPFGGGRISHEPSEKKIEIYGHSQGYGKADHEITAKLIKDAYPGYAITVISDDEES